MPADDYIRRVFAKNLRRLLAENDNTQIEVANALGVKPTTFSEWCRGNKYPRIDKIQKLADYFDCKVSDLVGSEIEYFAQRNKKANITIDERFNVFIEELSLRRNDFCFEGVKLDDSDISLLRLLVSNCKDVFRESLKNKYLYKGENDETKRD